MLTEQRVQTFRSSAEAHPAIDKVFPIRDGVILSEGRRLKARNAVLATAGAMIFDMLGWNVATVTLKPRQTIPHGGLPVRVRGAASRDGIIVSLDDADLEFQGEPVGPVHSRRQALAFVIQKAVVSALSSVDSIAATRTGTTDTDLGFEISSLGLEEWCRTAFLAQLFEKEPEIAIHFLLGHQPFAEGFQRGKAIIDWLRALPSATFEGSPLETGLVFENPDAPSLQLKGARSVDFANPIPFVEAQLDKQLLVLADGRTSFLRVDPAAQVRGLINFKSDFLEMYLDSKRPEPGMVDPLPHRIWIRAADTRRLMLFGEYAPDRWFHAATISRGRLRLHDPGEAVEVLTTAISSLSDHTYAHLAKAVALGALSRSFSGKGGGIIIGPFPNEQIDKQRVLAAPEQIAFGDNRWISHMNCDGALLLNKKLEVCALGVIVCRNPAPTNATKPAHTGSRHLAMWGVGLLPGCMGVAISDDGTLTAYSQGKTILRLE